MPTPAQASAPSSASSLRYRVGYPWGPGVMLAVVLVLAYGRSLSAPFLFDDSVAVLTNPTIRDLASWDVLRPPAEGGTTTGRPLVNLSLALNYAVAGERAEGYRVVNLALHWASALVLMGFIRRALELSAAPNTVKTAARGIAFVLALIWAIHPLQSETVICVAQRTELLASGFYLLTGYTFLRSVDSPERANLWRTLSVVSCAMGLASKEIVVTAPLMVLLMDRTWVSGSFGRAIKSKPGYYLALGSTWGLLAYLLVENSGARGVSAGFGLGVSSWDYLLTQAGALVHYLQLSFWPHPLVLDYGTRVTTDWTEAALPGLLILALLGGTIWALVKRPEVGLLGSWFFLILAPSSSVVPLVTQTVAEHRMYLPLAALVVGGGIVAFRGSSQIARYGALAAVVVGGTLTFLRAGDYRDVVVIWADTVRKVPENVRARNNLGLAWRQRGNFSEANRQFAESLRLQPRQVSGHAYWGESLLAEGRAEEAIPHLRAAIDLAADPQAARRNFGPALSEAQVRAGLVSAKAGQWDRAGERFRAALEVEPENVQALANLGNVLLLTGQSRQAIVCYEKALSLRPGDAQVREHLHLARQQASQTP